MNDKSTTGENPLLGMFHYRDLPENPADGVTPYQDNWCGHMVCSVCHTRYTASATKAAVSAAGVSFGDVCHECLEGGPKVIAEHLRKRAASQDKKAETAEARLREDAAQCRKAADAFDDMPADTWGRGYEVYDLGLQEENAMWEAEEAAHSAKQPPA